MEPVCQNVEAVDIIHARPDKTQDEYFDVPSKRFNKEPQRINLSDADIRTFARQIAAYVNKRTFAGAMESFEFQIEFHGIAVQGVYNVETRREAGTHFMGQTEWVDVIHHEETVITDAWRMDSYEDVPDVIGRLNKILTCDENKN